MFLNNSFLQEHFDSIHKQWSCKKHSDLIENFTCNYRRLGWKKAVYNADGYLRPGVELSDIYVCICTGVFFFLIKTYIHFIAHIQLKCTLYRRGTNLEYRIFGPKEAHMDICGFFNGTWTHIMVQMVELYLKRSEASENVSHPCPFSV